MIYFTTNTNYMNLRNFFYNILWLFLREAESW